MAVGPGTCPNGHPLAETDRFCDRCGILSRCENGHVIPEASASFCEACGAVLAPSRSPGGFGSVPVPLFLVAAGLFIVVVLVVAYFLTSSRGGDDAIPGAADDTPTSIQPTATAPPDQPVTVTPESSATDSPTVPTASPEPTGTEVPTEVPSETATEPPGAETPTTQAPTATRTPASSTSTSTPVAPTSTKVAATATSVPPTAVPSTATPPGPYAPELLSHNLPAVIDRDAPPTTLVITYRDKDGDADVLTTTVLNSQVSWSGGEALLLLASSDAQRAGTSEAVGTFWCAGLASGVNMFSLRILDLEGNASNPLIVDFRCK